MVPFYKRAGKIFAGVSLMLPIVLGAGLLFSGCARLRRPAPPPPADDWSVLIDIPEDDLEMLVPGNAAAIVRPGYALSLRVEVRGKLEVSEPRLRVSEEGELRLPLVGSIKADGLTLLQLRERIAGQYARYFVEPRIDVDFITDDARGIAPWGSVTVLGRVRKPGVVPLPATRTLSVIEAIQSAGGFESSANHRSVRVTNRKAESRTLDLRGTELHSLPPESIALEDGDIVYVPERFF